MSALLGFWLVVLLYMLSSFYQSCDQTQRIERQLDRAIEDINALTSQNKQLAALARDLRYGTSTLSPPRTNNWPLSPGISGTVHQYSHLPEQTTGRSRQGSQVQYINTLTSQNKQLAALARDLRYGTSTLSPPRTNNWPLSPGISGTVHQRSHLPEQTTGRSHQGSQVRYINTLTSQNKQLAALARDLRYNTSMLSPPRTNNWPLSLGTSGTVHQRSHLPEQTTGRSRQGSQVRYINTLTSQNKQLAALARDLRYSTSTLSPPRTNNWPLSPGISGTVHQRSHLPEQTTGRSRQGSQVQYINALTTQNKQLAALARDLRYNTSIPSPPRTNNWPLSPGNSGAVHLLCWAENPVVFIRFYFQIFFNDPNIIFIYHF